MHKNCININFYKYNFSLARLPLAAHPEQRHGAGAAVRADDRADIAHLDVLDAQRLGGSDELLLTLGQHAAAHQAGDAGPGQKPRMNMISTMRCISLMLLPSTLDRMIQNGKNGMEETISVRRMSRLSTLPPL